MRVFDWVEVEIAPFSSESTRREWCNHPSSAAVCIVTNKEVGGEEGLFYSNWRINGLTAMQGCRVFRLVI